MGHTEPESSCVRGIEGQSSVGLMETVGAAKAMVECVDKHPEGRWEFEVSVTGE